MLRGETASSSDARRVAVPTIQAARAAPAYCRTMSTRWFHGGAPGIKPGQLITPQPHDPGWKRDDCPTCESGVDDSHAPDRVFVTSSREYARMYASRYGKGDLYVVEPLGVMEPSDNDRFMAPSWSCERARVVSVYDRAVVMTRQQRWRLFRDAGKRQHPNMTTADLRREYEQTERAAVLMAQASLEKRREAAALDDLSAEIDALRAAVDV